MTSKRYKKLPTDTNKFNQMSFRTYRKVKENCTTKFDESIDLNFKLIINKKQINIRTVTNLPGGTGKQVKVAV